MGNDRLLHSESVAHGRCDFDGTVVHVAVNNQYAGHITIVDDAIPHRHIVAVVRPLDPKASEILTIEVVDEELLKRNEYLACLAAVKNP